MPFSGKQEVEGGAGLLFREKKWVFFDLGYTLVRTDREVRLQRTLAELGIMLERTDIEMAYHLVDKKFMREAPGLLAREIQEFAPLYNETLLSILVNTQQAEASEVGVHSLGGFELQWALETASADDFRGKWTSIPGVPEALLELRKQGLRLGLISNWDQSARSVLAETGLDEFLDPIIISSEVACQKPDAAIFMLALKQAGVSPHETLYIGDNYYDDIIGARGVGIEGLLINPFGRLGIEEIQDCVAYEGIAQITNMLILEQEASVYE